MLSVDRLRGGGGRFGNDFANGAFKAFDGDRRLDVWRDGIPESDSTRKEGDELLPFFRSDQFVLLMRVPDAASVFQDGADKGFITGFFNGPGAAMDVPSQKGKGGVSFGMNVVYVSGPGEFAVDSHSKVLGGVCQGEFSGVDEVVREDGLLLVGDAEGEAFAGVKFHFVISFPKLEGIEIFLELS